MTARTRPTKMPPSRNASGKGCRSRRRCRSTRIGWHPPSRHVLGHCIDRDIKALAALGKTGFLKIMAVTHTGITTDDFLKFVADWITIMHHPPRFGQCSMAAKVYLALFSTSLSESLETTQPNCYSDLREMLWSGI
jgi:hypothetical protein